MLIPLFKLLLIPCFCLAAVAQEQPFQTDAILIEKDGSSKVIQLLSATKNSVRYRISDGPPVETELTGGRLVFVMEPPGYTKAMDLYQARKYVEAKAEFSAVKKRYAPVKSLTDSYATLAAYYEMECLRQSGDLEALAAALQEFNYGPLTREYQLRQLELYVLWDAARTQSWERLKSLAAERLNQRLPGDQRAQVAYCHGLALEGLMRTDEALLAYHIALTADAGASAVVTRLAALRALAIYQGDPDVQAAISMRGKTDPVATIPASGHSKLAEAGALARLFVMTLGAGSPLPTEFREFLEDQGQP
jgi:hypothetical protein